MREAFLPGFESWVYLGHLQAVSEVEDFSCLNNGSVLFCCGPAPAPLSLENEVISNSCKEIGKYSFLGKILRHK